MKYEIMLGVLFDLLSKKTVTAKFLAQKYEVSVRTIYRYLSALESAGVPLYTVRGNNGGISIIDTYKFPSTFLTKAEFEQTINALTAIIEGVPNKALNSVITKLKANVKNEYNNVSLKTSNLIIDAGPWGDAVGYKAKLSVIQKSIEENIPLFLKYHDRNGSITERTVHPHIIVFKQGLWYVFAYCTLRKTFRFFKIGRIEQATLINDKFTRKDLSSLSLPLNFWENSVETENVIMEIDKRFLSDVEEWLGIENVKEKNGKYFADVNLPYDGGLVSKIMSFGEGIKVLQPIKLVEQIKIVTKQILKKYE